MDQNKRRELEEEIGELLRLERDIQNHNRYSKYPVIWRLDELMENAEIHYSCADNKQIRDSAENLLYAIKEVRAFRKTKKSLKKPTQELVNAIKKYIGQ